MVKWEGIKPGTERNGIGSNLILALINSYVVHRGTVLAAIALCRFRDFGVAWRLGTSVYCGYFEHACYHL